MLFARLLNCLLPAAVLFSSAPPVHPSFSQDSILHNPVALSGLDHKGVHASNFLKWQEVEVCQIMPRLIDIVFWKSQCYGQTQNHAFFCQVENIVVNRKAEEANKYQVDRWQICKTCKLNGLSTLSEKVLREDNCNKTQAFHCDTRTLLYLQCPLNIGTANKNVFVVYNLSNFLT